MKLQLFMSMTPISITINNFQKETHFNIHSQNITVSQNKCNIFVISIFVPLTGQIVYIIFQLVEVLTFCCSILYWFFRQWNRSKALFDTSVIQIESYKLKEKRRVFIFVTFTLNRYYQSHNFQLQSQILMTFSLDYTITHFGDNDHKSCKFHLRYTIKNPGEIQLRYKITNLGDIQLRYTITMEHLICKSIRKPLPTSQMFKWEI
jgi:hypothetical protein